MKKLAMFLYKKVCVLGVPLFCRRQVENDLAQLHPGERVEYIKTEYYVKKLTLFLAVLLSGAFLGLVVRVSAGKNSVLNEDGVVYRGEYQSGEKELLLAADDGESKRSFLIEVYPRELTPIEAKQLSDDFLGNLGSYILDGNEDFEHISKDLKLKDSYEGFPFEVNWESSREEVIDRQGRLGKIDQNISLELTVTLSYVDFERTEKIQVVAVPQQLSEEEQAYMELKNYLLETEEKSRGDETWILPEEWDGRQIE